MNKFNLLILLSIILTIAYTSKIKAQEEEPIRYFQMEPLDDSLFIHIQNELNIDPPDPKAEIIVDLRDVNNQTISIKGNLYPFLALKAETRAQVETFAFKINLEETIDYGSVFTRIFEKIKFNKIVSPPSRTQISPSLAYINPFFQFFGGERFGIPFKSDLGISFGFGTKYSGPGETNYVEANLHILGLTGGVFGPVEALAKIRENKSNNMYVTAGFNINYVIPFGNFFEFGYSRVLVDPKESQKKDWIKSDTINTHIKILDGSFFNFEIRYPISFFGSTRGKIYGGRFLNEWHIGYTGRELSLAGSTFDLRFDAMFNSDIRRDQYLLETLVQKIGESWAFSALAIGPSITLSKDDKGKLNVLSIFGNLRLKVGTSF